MNLEHIPKESAKVSAGDYQWIYQKMMVSGTNKKENKKIKEQVK